MTKDQILTKAIKKLYGRTVQVDFDTEGISITEKLGKDGFHNFCIDYTDKGYYGLIFSHEFAKEFWGRRPIYVHQLPGISVLASLADMPTAHILSKEEMIEEWQWHLQQMAMEVEPLGYIEKFL